MLFTDYLDALRRRWYVVLTTFVVCIALALGVSLALKPVYTGTASIFFSITFGKSANDLSQGATYTKSQVASYAALAQSPVVLDAVNSQLSLNTSATDLAKRVEATSSPDTVIVEISAKDPDPAAASRLANAVAQQLGVAVRELAPKDPQGNSTVSATTVSPASIPASPSSPQTLLNLLAGALGGIVLGVVIALLLASLTQSSRQRSRENDSSSFTSPPPERPRRSSRSEERRSDEAPSGDPRSGEVRAGEARAVPEESRSHS